MNIFWTCDGVPVLLSHDRVGWLAHGESDHFKWQQEAPCMPPPVRMEQTP